MKNGYIWIVVLTSLLIGVYGAAFLLSQGDLLKNISDYKDSIHAAYSLGRLDLITALLAIITILLAVFGAVGFNQVKVRSEQIARETAEEIAANTAKNTKKTIEEELKLISEEIRTNYRDLLRTIGEFHGIGDLIEGITGKRSEVGNKEVADYKFKVENEDLTILRSDTESTKKKS